MKGTILKAIMTFLAVTAASLHLDTPSAGASLPAGCKDNFTVACGTKLPGQDRGEAEYSKYQRSAGKYNRMFEMYSRSARSPSKKVA